MGNNCKYNGGNNRCQWVVDFAKDKSIIEICPEELGGLTAPRPPAEQIGDKVINEEGKDVTQEFKAGAKRGYEIASAISEKSGDIIEGAILKAYSPSCGCSKIYDGTFTRTVVDGDGYFARVLKSHGVKIITEADEKLLVSLG
jgi:uncharacterized protein YbbK (DUF523 family)